MTKIEYRSDKEGRSRNISKLSNPYEEKKKEGNEGNEGKGNEGNEGN